MTTRTISSLILAGALAASFAAHAADPPQPPADQVVVPEVDRRDIHVPHFPSNDFELGLFGGTYATQNFGASAIGGVRLGYHITEDFFAEGVYAYTKVSDEDFRQILPGGIFPKTSESLTYYNVSVGYNVLPGEIFLGGKRAKASAIYVITGVGSTKFDSQRRPTFNAGFGIRLSPPTGSPCSSTCATTCSRSTCSASGRRRRTSS